MAAWYVNARTTVAKLAKTEQQSHYTMGAMGVVYLTM